MQAGLSGADLENARRILPRYVGAGPRYTSYPTVPVWQDAFAEADHRRALAETGRQREISLYTHVPFCRSLCHFCACNRIITRDPALPQRFLDAIERELETTHTAIGGVPRGVQLHWGGGTPTHLEPGQIERLFRATTDRFPLAAGAEVSIEVDPRVTRPDHVAALVECGFNRISMGVQDTEPATQAAIHRIQPFEQTRDLTELVRARGIERVSFDLVYGLPHQTDVTMGRTLDAVLSLAPDRIALYAYAHVTWVAKQQRGFERGDLPGPDLRMRILSTAIERLTAAGYRAVGMDHFARPDDELCRALDEGTLRRNFMGYTTQDGIDVVAFGPTAISELSGTYVQAEKDLATWQGLVLAGRLATARGHRLTREDEKRRAIIRDVMCQGALRATAIDARFGGDFARDFAPALGRLRSFEDDGLVRLGVGGDVDVTPLGRLFLRNIAMVFDAYLDDFGDGVVNGKTSAKAGTFSQTV
ncbi:MAG: oxygen-independent coproporphyrinogen III oxidase [Deltaproteobacteria bacterium]|nr:oxygen-independent coproporphyrinogen III oxidase [Deltaproteobacteria bacterium]